MPVYEYLCDDCGPFTAVRAMAEYRDPCGCPDCGTEAPRAILTPPRLAGMDAGHRKAIGVNERASHEPKRASAHGAGCSCCSGKSTKETATAANGAKSFPSARPWMISH